jgi:methylated-DNA-[protein]-cysteine S-methyltransferase
VPCHRVVAAGGGLGGYAGGLPMKRWLLAHEARTARFALRPGIAHEPLGRTA